MTAQLALDTPFSDPGVEQPGGLVRALGRGFSRLGGLLAFLREAPSARS